MSFGRNRKKLYLIETRSRKREKEVDNQKRRIFLHLYALFTPEFSLFYVLFSPAMENEQAECNKNGCSKSCCARWNLLTQGKNSKCFVQWPTGANAQQKIKRAENGQMLQKQEWRKNTWNKCNRKTLEKYVAKLRRNKNVQTHKTKGERKMLRIQKHTKLQNNCQRETYQFTPQQKCTLPVGGADGLERWEGGPD